MNPRRADSNQSSIVHALRSIGASVQPIHMVGKGCVDILVGYRGKNYCLEIKDGTQPPSRQKLTQDEAIWHAQWRGQVAIVRTIDEAFIAVGATE